MSAGFNLWGVDPRILVNMPVGRNMAFVGLFLVVQLLGLAGAVLMFQGRRLGFVLSIVHHVLLLPALVITGLGLVMMMDDRINLTLMFMSRPTGSDISLFYSLGWNTVFQQVTPNVPNGSTYIGINLFALACAYVLWVVVRETDMYEEDDEDDEPERETRPRQRPSRGPQLALPSPQYFQQQQQQQPRMHPQQGGPQQQRKNPQQGGVPQQQRMRPPQGAPQPQRMAPQQGARQPPRMPPRGRDDPW